MILLFAELQDVPCEGQLTPLTFPAQTQTCSLSAQCRVIGPSEPVGETVTLPCHLQPATDASHLTVEWLRPDLDPRFVLVRRGSVELQNMSHPSYSSTTSLLIDELKEGNISLKLSEVKCSTWCVHFTFNEAFSSVPSPGFVSSPVITKISRNSRGAVELDCESKGWYPELEVLWLDSEGNLLSAGPTETLRGPDDLYTVSVTGHEYIKFDSTCGLMKRNRHKRLAKASARLILKHSARSLTNVPPSESTQQWRPLLS
uniref:Butyrophilin subfamily 3 member A2-like Ig-C domain-containing protein n=1 Tax=Mastacembelus armatus TaxID=205130 RepID=A0A7N8YDI6_9TELE